MWLFRLLFIAYFPWVDFGLWCLWVLWLVGVVDLIGLVFVVNLLVLIVQVLVFGWYLLPCDFVMLAVVVFDGLVD